jgi:long-chain acyl-CoA synthetase
MGSDALNESNPFQYHEFKTKPKKGETGILVRPDCVNSLDQKNYIGKFTQLECLEYQKAKRPNSNFLGTREYNPNTKKYGKYIWKSYTQIYDLATYFLYGITKFNLCTDISVDDDILGKNQKMKFMGFYCRTREEWVVGDFGCHMDSITIVTIYETLGIDSVEYILKQTELTTILAESIYLGTLLKIKEQNKMGNVKNIIYISCNEEIKNLDETIEKLKNSGLSLISYETIIATGKKCLEEKDEEILDKNYKKISPEHIQLICYTSGTTNNPKGVMIPAKCIALSQNWVYNIGYHPTGEDRMLSFLPLAHIIEHLFLTINLVFGVQIGFYNGNTGKLVEDFQELHPTIFCGVPRIYEKLYQTIMENVNKRGTFYKKLFDKALATKIYNYEKYGRLSHAFFDKIFFNEIRNFLGGKLAYMTTCAASMNKVIMQSLKVMIGCCFVEGYGQTEGGGSCIMCNIKDINVGRIGGVANTLELKLVDLPEMGYLTTDVNPKTGLVEPRGEICYRGQFISKGYYKNIIETNKTFDKDGWLHSGDIGVILTKNGNALKIIDRLKSLFKLNQGEYVAPDKVQSILIKSKYILQIFLYGESQYNYAVALVYPELKECINFLKENKKMGDIDYDALSYDDLVGNKIMEEEIIKDCSIVGRKLGLKGFELPKKLSIINEAFSTKNNLMTSILKLKPREIKKKYIDVLNKMYEEKL